MVIFCQIWSWQNPKKYTLQRLHVVNLCQNHKGFATLCTTEFNIYIEYHIKLSHAELIQTCVSAITCKSDHEYPHKLISLIRHNYDLKLQT